MGRRKSTLTRSGNTVEAHYYITKPSGVTISGALNRIDINKVYATTLSGTSYVGNVDFGQGTAYKVYMGAAPLSMNAPTNGTRLSDGTVQFATGLTTINSFSFDLQCSAVSPGRNYFPRGIHWMRGYKTAGGVTVFLNACVNGVAWSACTPGGINLAGGSTISWIAMGV